MTQAGATIVVVGSGGAGLAAALAAAEAARANEFACRIILIEKARAGTHGGNTRWSPSYMRMAASDRLEASFADDLRAISGGRMDEAYIRRLAAEAPATIAWLMRHGIAFDRPVYYLSAGPPRIQPVGGGATILRELERAALEAGVDIRYESAAERLLVGGNGAVEGIELRTADGAAREDRGSRGRARDRRLCRQRRYAGAPSGSGAESLRPISPGTSFNTGDGIRMALAAGARADGDWNGMHAEPVDPRSKASAPVVLVYPYGIVVDRTGRRFFDEGGGLVHETWESARAHHSLRDARAHRLRRPRCQTLRDRRLSARDPLGGATLSGGLDRRAGGPHRCTAERAAGDGRALQRRGHRRCGEVRCDPHRRPGGRSGSLAAEIELGRDRWTGRPISPIPLIGAIAYTFGGVATDADARGARQERRAHPRPLRRRRDDRAFLRHRAQRRRHAQGPRVRPHRRSQGRHLLPGAAKPRLLGVSDPDHWVMGSSRR